MNNLNNNIIVNGKYVEFVETILQMVSKKMGEQFQVRKECADKNNNTIRWGICISDLKDKSQEVRLSPTIYLEEYYEEYVEGCELNEIVQHIIEVYYEVSNPIQFNLECFEFDNMKEKICFKLINQDMNLKLLEGMPHRQFCDLAVAYYVQIIDDERGIGTIPVTDSLMTFWNVDENILWEFAYKNTRNLLIPKIQPVKDAIYGCTGEVVEDLSLFTLSNGSRHFGAASVLYEETLYTFSEMIQSNYFLLPLSIHEWVLIVDDGTPSKESCDTLVHYLNREKMPCEKILADHAYYYDRKQRKILY